jgi:hypothetical protein
MLSDKMDRPTLGCGLKHASEEEYLDFNMLCQDCLCNRKGGAVFVVPR